MYTNKHTILPKDPGKTFCFPSCPVLVQGRCCFKSVVTQSHKSSGLRRPKYICTAEFFTCKSLSGKMSVNKQRLARTCCDYGQMNIKCYLLRLQFIQHWLVHRCHTLPPPSVSPLVCSCVTESVTPQQEVKEAELEAGRGWHKNTVQHGKRACVCVCVWDAT